MARLLLTPGPLTTSGHTRDALGRDWGSRDPAFVAMSEAVRARLARLAGVQSSHAAVPLPGSGTSAVEAAIQTLVPRDGWLLVLANGAYGQRMAEIARRCGRRLSVLEAAETVPVRPDLLAARLGEEPAITDVAVVHCETTTGLLNPVEAVAEVTARAGRRLLVDAMSSFGAIPLDGARVPFTALAASSNKGLEGVPGMGFVLAETGHLAASAGQACSLSLDLHDQWRGFEANGQWRFTPPVQVVAALSAALDQLDEEGGVVARNSRYRRLCDRLVGGMRALGFETLLADRLQAPVIVTFREPEDGWFSFARFYDFLQERDVVIYPGKLSAEPSFRIGCIGAIGDADIDQALQAVAAFVARQAPHGFGAGSRAPACTA